MQYQSEGRSLLGEFSRLILCRTKLFGNWGRQFEKNMSFLLDQVYNSKLIHIFFKPVAFFPDFQMNFL